MELNAVTHIFNFPKCCMCTCNVSLTAQVRVICSWCMKIYLRRAARISIERLISVQKDWQMQIISKKYFSPGGMARSEWTQSVRSARDTQVADYSAPGLMTTRHVTDHPLIGVSQFLLSPSVSYFKRTLRRCGQL
jgi:hypothetical protein